MALRYFAVYALLEIAAFVAMAVTLGFGWAVLISIAAGVLGFLTLRWQGRKVFGELRRAANNEVDARAPLADTALVATSTILLVVPGVVSTVAGILLLFPPTRKVMRPVVVAVGARRMATAMDRAGLYATGIYGGGIRGGGATVVDGTVVESDTPETGFGAASPQMTTPQLPPTR
ncbi:MULTISPECIES: FxsA family protein [Gordonia]|uniref:FxsA family protein n=1 Tax=Gordonia amicalis TaxID=89053 RepID=A0AAE4R8G5_9ACTN|nr:MULTISPECIES: FxsA family protein [Gordonia]MCR8897129.1 FxsA family protein [Gordonia sp. GONU]MCZ4653105.1 FxsA family protein [Gordonia amicalis]MDJ0451032.1 FxsA family protein [Gordonia amicalis]MDV6308762.1 FxsA family protein [Gordonia amicalis]MDV6313782.1 FxsA family protein [Gordonia amicalis]